VSALPTEFLSRRACSLAYHSNSINVHLRVVTPGDGVGSNTGQPWVARETMPVARELFLDARKKHVNNCKRKIGHVLTGVYHKAFPRSRFCHMSPASHFSSSGGPYITCLVAKSPRSDILDRVQPPRPVARLPTRGSHLEQRHMLVFCRFIVEDKDCCTASSAGRSKYTSVEEE
jgi:hypothetical protein